MRKMMVWTAVVAFVASIALVGCSKGGPGAKDAPQGPDEVKAMMSKGGGTQAGKAVGTKPAETPKAGDAKPAEEKK